MSCLRNLCLPQPNNHFALLWCPLGTPSLPFTRRSDSSWVNVCEQCEVGSWLFFPPYGHWISLTPFMEKTILFWMSCSGLCCVCRNLFLDSLLCSVIGLLLSWLFESYHWFKCNRTWKFTFLIGINSYNRVFVREHLFIEKLYAGHFTNMMTLWGLGPFYKQRS